MFGIVHAGKLVQKAVCGIDIYKICIHLIAEHADNLFRFALAEQTVVDVNAGELLADRFYEQCGDDGGIHPAGKREQHLAATDKILKLLCFLCDKFPCKLRRVYARHAFGANIGIHNSLFPSETIDFLHSTTKAPPMQPAESNKILSRNTADGSYTDSEGAQELPPGYY